MQNLLNWRNLRNLRNFYQFWELVASIVKFVLSFAPRVFT